MKNRLILLVLPILFVSYAADGQSIVTTRHNLSISGPGTVKATNESEICIFCHTPHNSRPNAPLWNRNDPGTSYTLYMSSTMQAAPGQPDGSSILCLSCHDGTVALGSVLNRPGPIAMATGTFMPSGNSNLTSDLRNDHPISFIYNTTVASSDGELKDPSAITPPVDLQNGKMQCTSCHDPHIDLNTKFLVASTQNSVLCNSCHTKNNWANGSHNTSTKTWNGTAPDPWPYSPYTTVAQNGCANCHQSHNSGSNTLLMKYTQEEANCLDCHNGNGASKNLAAQFAKTYKHNVAGYTGVHDANESSQVTNMHVECSDCHNPHESRVQAATAPSVNGFQTGVKGVTQAGAAVTSATYEYEICYRCHAGSPGAPAAADARVIVQNNTRLEFDGGNPSFHAVAAQGINTSVPSLIAPWTTTSRMYCSDCHASDGAGSPVGPHGSNFPHILVRQYTTTDPNTESAASYALCYACHNRAYFNNEATSNTGNFRYHFKHVLDKRTPCNTCHDPHGISSTQGTAANNSNLINFNTAYVTPSPGNGAIRFEDRGSKTGRCYLTCHNTNHTGWSY